jgi:MFS family permease
MARAFKLAASQGAVSLSENGMSEIPRADAGALKLSIRELWIALALGLGAFFTNLDVTAVVVALPAMARDLGFGMAATAWVVDAYSLAFTGMLLLSGSLADRFGRRRTLMGSFLSRRSHAGSHGTAQRCGLHADCKASVLLSSSQARWPSSLACLLTLRPAPGHSRSWASYQVSAWQ